MNDEPCPHCQKGLVYVEQGRGTAKCQRCFGTGKKGAKRPRPCPWCQGTGVNQGSCVECMGSGIAAGG